jgi:hypothetical protein
VKKNLGSIKKRNAIQVNADSKKEIRKDKEEKAKNRKKEKIQ